MNARISSMLVQRGIVDVATLQEALALQAIRGGTLDTALLEGAQAEEAVLIDCLSESSGWPPGSPQAIDPSDPALAATLPVDTARRLACCPIARRDGQVLLLCSDATDAAGLARLRAEHSEALVPLASTEVRVEQARAVVYGLTLSPRFVALLERLGPVPPIVVGKADRAEPPASVGQGRGPAQAAVTEGAACRPALAALSTAEGKALFLAADDLAILPGTLAQSSEATPPDPTAGAEADSDLAQGVDEVTTPGIERIDALLPGVARQFIEQASDRDDVLLYLLRGAHSLLPAVQIFAARSNRLQGLIAVVGGELDRSAVRRRRIPLSLPSLLSEACHQLEPYLGPLTDSAGNATAMLRAEVLSSQVVLVPVAVGGKAICLLIGHDPTDAPLAAGVLEPLRALAQAAATALGRLIAEQRRQSAEFPSRAAATAARRPAQDPRTPADAPRSHAPETVRSPTRVSRRRQRARVAPAPLRRPAENAGPAAETPAANTPAGALPIEALVAAIAQRGPQHGALTAELRRREASALAWLMERFPGPSIPAEARVDAPSPSAETQPILYALSLLGRRVLPALASELTSEDEGRRLGATLLLGELVDAEAIALLALRLRDASPLVRAAACRAVLRIRRHDQLADARDELRTDLAHPEPRRQAAAMVALGALGDNVAAPSLIALLRDPRAEVAQAARLALALLTKQDFHDDVAAWTAWWARHRTRPHTEWLIEALTHPALELRQAAALELYETTGGDLAYDASAPAPALLAAQERWRRWWATQRRSQNPDHGATRGKRHT
ncbi:MAG: HEAT repeat domain-containing protein [Proteobacteria bacterium]|nr:HEAT repeat domain-containing protein [Pseudomonadota bacterium]